MIVRYGWRVGVRLGLFGMAQAAGPAFDCDKVESGSIEADVCADPALSALDVRMAEVYAAARDKAGATGAELRAMQRGWIKGRNECWKEDDRRVCIRETYVRRIAELQARYRLVALRGPVFFACDGNPANELVVTYFDTDPGTLIAERGDSSSLMFVTPSASGARYAGGNESFWEHAGEARVVWGFEAPEMVCKPASSAG